MDQVHTHSSGVWCMAVLGAFGITGIRYHHVILRLKGTTVISSLCISISRVP